MIALPTVGLTAHGAELIGKNVITIPESCIAKADGNIEPGASVRVTDRAGNFLGKGYYNPNSKLPLRLLTFLDEDTGVSLIRRRIQDAWNYRMNWYGPEDSFRWIYGESDWMPGVIADWFSGHLILQITTAGMDRRIDELLEAFCEFQPQSVTLVNDSLPRVKEGLSNYRRIVNCREDPPWKFMADGLWHYLNPLEGHKTGFFLDHRENRIHSSRWCREKRVLDVFCYSGAFSLAAANAGAKEVLGIDVFEPGLRLAGKSAEANGLDKICRFSKEEAFHFLSRPENHQAWDVIFLDPPSFVRGGNRARRNIANYKKINRAALDCLKPEGVLVSSICSYSVSLEDFYLLLGQAISESGCSGRICGIRHAGPDHPVRPGMPELDYLKCLTVFKSGNALSSS